MIPPDLASSLRLIQPANLPQQTTQTQPVPGVQQITDALSNPTPGQRILAEVQSMLPNGTYRAMVGQREIVLSLPFPAKAGDSLELEVVESNGKLTLAFLANKGGAGQKSAGSDAAVANLSTTGRLIGSLLGRSADGGSAALSLNGNLPLSQSVPPSAPALAANLKQALTQSGMFYEAHQVRWVKGDMPTDALRQEPQGKASMGDAKTLPQTTAQGTTATAQQAATQQAAIQQAATQQNADVQNILRQGRHDANSVATQQMPREVAPIVQQQLDALASQQFVWQGQSWPGQPMEWTITEQGKKSDDAEESRQWQTRLSLKMPVLGNINAVLRLLPNEEISLQIQTNRFDSEEKMQSASDALRQQLADAGLTLVQFQVKQEEEDEPTEIL